MQGRSNLEALQRALSRPAGDGLRPQLDNALRFADEVDDKWGIEVMVVD